MIATFMLMLKITFLFQIFTAYKVLTVNKIDDIEICDKLIKKFVKPKTEKLFKSQKSKKKILAISKKPLKNKNLTNFKNKITGLSS